MRAALVAVGSELLGPLRTDTNSTWLTERLLDVGVEVVGRATLADEPRLLESALRSAIDTTDVVIITGGLGPTADDLTREAAAAALDRRLVRDSSIVEDLRARFGRFGRKMPAINEKQGDLIEGAVALDNPRGTAPGQRVEHRGRLLILLPGPPSEMKPLFEKHVLPDLRARGRVVRRRVLKIAAMAESQVDEIVAPLYRGVENPRTTILGAPGQIELHLVGEGASGDEAEERIEALARGLRERLPGRIFSEDGRELPAVVGGLLLERALSLAIAESCTGGLLSARLTDVPGASGFLDRSFVTYSNRSKIQELGVDAELLDRAGAVSEEVAAAMADGARRVAETEIGIGITGIAGPEGGTDDKPVGLVFIAVDGAAGTRVQRARFPGWRERVRFQATQVALEMLRRGLLGLEPG
ncbi:MAG: competence/damage-inducible protein A [Acidobacteria bacterium]|jgi:nicotinamide-nucleotide amidase|nr:competence/damage-inducible protein A [Acidobacteriota bacterium]